MILSSRDGEKLYDAESWNAALDAAAKLVGETGFVWVRRPLDRATMTHKIDIYPGNPKIKGTFDETTHVDASEMEAAAILSLKIGRKP